MGLTRRLFSFALVLAISSIPAVAHRKTRSQSQTESEQHRIGAIKAKVVKLAAGKKVQVKLLSNQTLIGAVEVISDDQFTLIESPRRAAVPIRYQEVKSIKQPGSGWEGPAVLIGIFAGVIGFTLWGLHGG